MNVFKDPGSTHEQIYEAELKIVAAHFSTYQNSVSEKLNEAREIQFHKKCSSKSTKRGVNLASLVPSEDSVCLHLDIAYFQIRDWQGNALEPTDNGWEIKDGLLEPIPMRQDPAPICLMEVTQCKCKATKCTSGMCSWYLKLRDVQHCYWLPKLREPGCRGGSIRWRGT